MQCFHPLAVVNAKLTTGAFSPRSITHLQPSTRYHRHQPEDTSRYPIIEQNLPVLRDALQQQEASLSGFVLAEFEDYLRCGRLEHGFVRVFASNPDVLSRCLAVIVRAIQTDLTHRARPPPAAAHARASSR